MNFQPNDHEGALRCDRSKDTPSSVEGFDPGRVAILGADQPEDGADLVESLGILQRWSQ